MGHGLAQSSWCHDEVCKLYDLSDRLSPVLCSRSVTAENVGKVEDGNYVRYVDITARHCSSDTGYDACFLRRIFRNR